MIRHCHTRDCALLSLLLALAVFTPPALAQVVPPPPQTLPSPLTLSQAIGIALAHQPQQYSARAQTNQALGQRQQAVSQYYPTFQPSYQFQSTSRALYGVTVPTPTVTTGSGSTTVIGTGSTGTGVGTGTGSTGTGTVATGARVPHQTTGTGGGTSNTPQEVTIVRGGGLALSVTQNIFDSGQRELSNAQARRAVDIAGFGEANTRQDIILAVTQNFYNLLQALDLVKVAQAQVNRYQQTLDVTQAQVAAGTTAGKDVYQSQADLASAQVTLLQQQNSVRTASAALKNALGVETDNTVQPAPLATGTDLPPLPTSGPARTLDDYVQQAYASRPDLRQQQASVQSSNEAVKAAEIETRPNVAGTFALTYQATNDISNRGLDTQFLLTGSYPLFDAGRVRGQVRVARAQRDVTRNNLAQLRLNVRQDVEQAYSTRETALAATQLAQAAVQAAQVNYDAAIAARQEGAGTILDVTTAQVTLTQAQNQYVSAIYNFYIADAALRRAAGQNDVVPGTPAAP